eukprot:gene5340-10684_t
MIVLTLENKQELLSAKSDIEILHFRVQLFSSCAIMCRFIDLLPCSDLALHDLMSVMLAEMLCASSVEDGSRKESPVSIGDACVRCIVICVPPSFLDSSDNMISYDLNSSLSGGCGLWFNLNVLYASAGRPVLMNVTIISSTHHLFYILSVQLNCVYCGVKRCVVAAACGKSLNSRQKHRPSSMALKNRVMSFGVLNWKHFLFGPSMIVVPRKSLCRVSKLSKNLQLFQFCPGGRLSILPAGIVNLPCLTSLPKIVGEKLSDLWSEDGSFLRLAGSLQHSFLPIGRHPALLLIDEMYVLGTVDILTRQWTQPLMHHIPHNLNYRAEYFDFRAGEASVVMIVVPFSFLATWRMVAQTLCAISSVHSYTKWCCKNSLHSAEHVNWLEFPYSLSLTYANTMPSIVVYDLAKTVVLMRMDVCLVVCDKFVIIFSILPCLCCRLSTYVHYGLIRLLKHLRYYHSTIPVFNSTLSSGLISKFLMYQMPGINNSPTTCVFLMLAWTKLTWLFLRPTIIGLELFEPPLVQNYELRLG